MEYNIPSPTDVDFTVFNWDHTTSPTVKWSSFKKVYPDLAKMIIEFYKPVFDKPYALKYWMDGILPPSCEICGKRINTSKKQSKRCKTHAKGTWWTYEQFVSVNTTIYTINEWKGWASGVSTTTFICPVHGNFNSSINRILRGDKCVKCPRKLKLAYDTPTWIEMCTTLHNGKYDYSKSIYTGSDNHVIIICPHHGEFTQRAIVHSRNHGCPKCSAELSGIRSSYTTESYILAANSVHNNKYSYEKTIYTGIRNPVTITCHIHGDFEQIASYHTAGNGCQKCGASKIVAQSSQEFEISNFLTNHNIEHIHGMYIDGIEIDIYIPSAMVGIEFNGCYWHSSNTVDTDYYYERKHINKTISMMDRDITLLHITESEWLDTTTKSAWESHILRTIGALPIVSCDDIAIIDAVMANKFIDTNSIIGTNGSDIFYGMYDESENIVAVYGFSYSSDPTDGMLSDVAILNGVNIHNDVSSISERFMHDSNRSITVNVPLNYSYGLNYSNNGFKLIGHIEPTGWYWYKNSSSLLSESQLPATLLDEANNIGESIQFMAYMVGYRRIWDCGSLIYKLEITNVIR